MFTQLSHFLNIGKKSPAMVNIRIEKMKSFFERNKQRVDKTILKDWIEEMDGGKWYNNI